jgi:hypothetical protein
MWSGSWLWWSRQLTLGFIGISSAKLGILSFFFATTNDGDETYNSGININIYNIHIIN